MMIYLIVISALLFLSLRYDILGASDKYRIIAYNIVLLFFILIAGLRYRIGVDTTRYITSFYHEYPLLWNVTVDDFSFGSDPLYMLINSIVHSFGGKFYIVQLIHSAFVNILIFKYIKKHTCYIFLTVLFYFLVNYTGYLFDTMRASMSISICLFANDFVMEKKYIKAVVLYIIGCMFHFSTLFIMITPILFWLRANKTGIIIIIFTFFVGAFLRSNLGEYLPLLQLSEKFDTKAYYYLHDEGSVDNHFNLYGYLGSLIPCIYPFFAVWYLKKKGIYVNELEPMVIVGIILMVISFYVPILRRFAGFFYIYLTIYEARFFAYIARRKNFISKGLNLFISVVIFVPFFLMTFKKYKDMKMVETFYPYSSIFDQTINLEREKVFNFYEGDPPRPGEY